jgi:hypothetical protein
MGAAGVDLSSKRVSGCTLIRFSLVLSLSHVGT